MRIQNITNGAKNILQNTNKSPRKKTVISSITALAIGFLAGKAIGYDHFEKEQIVNLQGNNLKKLKKHQYTYIKNRSVEIVYDSNENITEILERTYDIDGKNIKTVSRDVNGKMYHINEFTYDTVGNKIGYINTQYDYDGNINAIFEYT